MEVSTGAPLEMPGCPVMPNFERLTESGIVRSNVPLLRYTVIECLYIMFCANTRPLPVASTDFGEIAPPMVLTFTSRRRSDGMPGAFGLALGLADVVALGRADDDVSEGAGSA